MWKYGLNIARMLYSYHSRQVLVNHHPFITSIEVTNDCNLSCRFCRRDLVKQRGIGYMSDDTFNNIVNWENRRFIRHLRLLMHGEPLLHPDIAWFVKDAKRFVKTVGFTTNGLLMTEEKAKALLYAELDTICFSLHSPKIKENLHRFLELKNNIHPSCYVSISAVKPYENDTLKILEGCKVDNVVLLDEHDWGFTGRRNTVCLWPWWGFDIYWNGDVAPCCIAEARGVMGNINEQSIKEIWNSEQYMAFRRGMLDGSACHTCSYTQTNLNEPYLNVTQPSLLAYPKVLWQMVGTLIKRL